MSRDVRPSRAGAGAFPTRPQQKQQRYDEYDDEYPVNKRYYSNELPDDSPSQRGGGGRARYGDSSGSSSLMDRMKVKSYEKPSSRASVDQDEEYEAPRTGGKATWARKPGQARNAPPPSRVEERQEAVVAQDPGSAGNTLWGRVVGALTINVSKAWESSGQDGPETPPGGETRLTKAMKEYYLQRARAHTDLPAWLFDERERMPTRPPPRERAAINAGGNRGRYDEDYGDEEPPPRPQPARGALRDVYDKAASKPAPAGRSAASSTATYASDTGPVESKATSRLRAIREAKRQEAGIGGSSSYVPSKYDTDFDSGRRTTERSGLPNRRYN